MYMYKTSITWSVQEGAHLGVSTFLTNSVKCTQGWILCLVAFFFRATPCEFLDMENNNKLYKHKVTNPSLTWRRCWACPAPAWVVAFPLHTLGEAGPKDLRSLLKTVRPSWTWWLGWLEAFSAASMRCPTISPPLSISSKRYLYLNFQVPI